MNLFASATSSRIAPAGHSLIFGGGDSSLADIPGIVALYDASQMSGLYQDDAKTTKVTASGQAVGAIADLISGRDLLQGTASKRPLYKASDLNGGPCFVGDGVDDMMATASFTTLNQPQTYIFCGQLQGTTTRTFLDGTDSSAPKIYVQTDWTVFAGGTSRDTGFAANTNPHVFAATFNGGSSIFQQDTSTSSSYNPGSGTTSDTLLLANKTGTSNSSIRVGLLIVVNGTISANTYAQVQNYCRTRWGTS